jgi:hypothetical protein
MRQKGIAYEGLRQRRCFAPLVVIEVGVALAFLGCGSSNSGCPNLAGTWSITQDCSDGSPSTAAATIAQSACTIIIMPSNDSPVTWIISNDSVTVEDPSAPPLTCTGTVGSTAFSVSCPPVAGGDVSVQRRANGHEHRVVVHKHERRQQPLQLQLLLALQLGIRLPWQLPVRNDLAIEHLQALHRCVYAGERLLFSVRVVPRRVASALVV